MAGRSSAEKDAKRLEQLEADIAKADEELRRQQEAVSAKKREARKIRARLKYSERKSQAAALRDRCAEQSAEIERLREEIAAMKDLAGNQNRSAEAASKVYMASSDELRTPGQMAIEISDVADGRELCAEDQDAAHFNALRG